MTIHLEWNVNVGAIFYGNLLNTGKKGHDSIFWPQTAVCLKQTATQSFRVCSKALTSGDCIVQYIISTGNKIIIGQTLHQTY